MVESLDPLFLKNELKKICTKDELKDLGSLKLFEKWLDKGLIFYNFADIALPFYVLYDFRIISSHLVSDVKKQAIFKSINQRLDLSEDNDSYELIYDSLINKLCNSYKIILTQL